MRTDEFFQKDKENIKGGISATLLPTTRPNFTGIIPEPPVSAYLKFVVLGILCLQNAGHTLLTRYSQGVLRERYSSTEVVLFGEVIKLGVSATIVYQDKSSELLGSGWVKLLWLTVHSKKIIVLVVLYSLGNVLSYYALARIEASVYTVTSQLKIFSTAVFSVIFLGKEITGAKWRALCLLVIACILVASPAFNSPQAFAADDDEKEQKALGGGGHKSFNLLDYMLGVGAVLVVVIIRCDFFSSTHSSNE